MMTTRPIASFRLSALDSVEPLGALLDTTLWRSSSVDPQFQLLGEMPRASEQVYVFDVDVQALDGASGPPVLYFDFGSGYEADCALAMSRTSWSPKTYSAAVRLRARPRHIRFDPCSAPGEFLCSDVVCSAVSGSDHATPVTQLPPAPQGATAAFSARPGATRPPRTAVVLHLHYEDLWPELAGYIANVPGLERLYASIPSGASRVVEERIVKEFPCALVRRVPNRGRDAWPFLQWIEIAAMQAIDLVCKIHSKRSPQVPRGDAWRKDLLDKLLGTPALAAEAIEAFRDDPTLGLLGPGGHLVPLSRFWEQNAERVEDLSRRMGQEPRQKPYRFVAGSMYWARVEALLPLRRMALGDADFDAENGAAQGAMHHALERCIPIAADIAGFRLAETANPQGTTVDDFAPHLADPRSYAKWIEAFEIPPGQYPALAALHPAWPRRPLISIVMPTYETRREDLERAIESVLAQVYPHWELCVADDASRQPHVREILERHASRDPRIKVAYRETNGHIVAASNSALDLAAGEFVALLDHDDELHPLALHFVAEAILDHPDCELIYSDEDKIALDGARQDPYFKSEFNYELLLAHNMVSHLGCYRASTLREVGGFRAGFEGSQDYDLALRFVERARPSQIVHIPRVLYHWRISQGSTAMAGDEKPYAQIAARRAIAEHLERTGIQGEVLAAPEAPGMNRVRFAVPSPQPSVTIIIPTRDRADLLEMCVGSLLERTTYANYSILVIDNGSRETATARLFERLRGRGVAIRRDPAEFNFSALNNRAVASVSSDFVCLMNNDIEIITPDWLEEMVGMANRPGIGAVGARLWYPGGGLQHAGVVVGVLGVAGHAHKHVRRGDPGYFGRAVLHQAMSVVTAACLLVRRGTYQKVGGLDESLRVAFNDVDFCLKLQAAGYRNVWTPNAEMIHHESASRGYETSPDKRVRFNREIDRIMTRWKGVLANDPFYSPNLTLEREDFSLAWPPRLPAPGARNAAPAPLAVEA